MSKKKSIYAEGFSIEERVRTVSWKFREVTESYPQLKNKGGTKIVSSCEMYKAFNFIFKNETRELFVVFWLSSMNKVIGFEIISIGSLNATIVHSREIFRGAIVSSCANIIIAHNHPSGSLDPSSEDISVTRRLVDAGKVIEINIYDHIIFTNDDYFSFLDHKLI